MAISNLRITSMCYFLHMLPCAPENNYNSSYFSTLTSHSQDNFMELFHSFLVEGKLYELQEILELPCPVLIHDAQTRWNNGYHRLISSAQRK